MPVRGAIAIAVAVFAFSLAGCGDGDEATSADGVTHAQLIERARAVCERIRVKRKDAIAAYDEQAAKRGEDPGSRSALEDKLNSLLIPLMRERLHALEGLEVPAADRDGWTKLLDHYATGIEKVETEGLDGLAAPQLLQYVEEARRLRLARCMA